MLKRRESDPVARNALLAIAAGRVALGAGALLATRPALRALGFRDADPSSQALAKMTGGRDIALGLLPLLARDDPVMLRTAGAAAAAVDVVDAVSMGLAARRGEIGAAGFTGALSGAAAAAAGIWAAGRLA
jgi:hypothetical protein